MCTWRRQARWRSVPSIFVCLKIEKMTPSYGVLLMGKKTKKPTVDGCEILHQLVDLEGLCIPFKSHYLQCFTVTNSCQLVQDFDGFCSSTEFSDKPISNSWAAHVGAVQSDSWYIFRRVQCFPGPFPGSIFRPHCYSSYSHFHREHEVLIHRNWGFGL